MGIASAMEIIDEQQSDNTSSDVLPSSQNQLTDMALAALLKDVRTHLATIQTDTSVPFNEYLLESFIHQAAGTVHHVTFRYQQMRRANLAFRVYRRA